MNRFAYPVSALLLCLALTLPHPACAVELPAAPPVTMPTVTVTGTAEAELSGSSTLAGETLQQLPLKNGSVTEALGILPGVQLGELSRTSDNAGEILPPSISISGGRFYDNNFAIDGIGNNSLLDPAFNNTADRNRVPGHPQEFFLHPSLLGEVTVYRSNVSARYGSFTGGVVDITTRDPANTLGGQVNLRHNRSEWTEIHAADGREAEYDHPTTGKVQPDFRKYDASFSVDLPINDESGLLIAASRIYSDIPLALVDSTEHQYRTLDNYFLKYVNQLSTRHRLSISGNYTPYEADLFLPETVGSNYTISNQAHGLSAKLQSDLEQISIEIDLGYRSSSNHREAPADYFAWQVTEAKPWGDITDADFAVGRRTSKEGSYGDLEQEQDTWTANLHASLEPMRSSVLSHQINFGIGFEHVKGHYERDGETAFYSGVCGPYTSSAICKPDLANIVACAPGSPDCIANEQFMYQKTVYPADDVNAVIRFYDAYIEDTITWGRLTVRPGLRFSSDDLQHNDNWATRLAASYDLFGDGSSLLRAGRNRYYGKTLLTHALAENRVPLEIWKRDNKELAPGNVPKAWTFVPSSVITATRLADLKTPYADEWAVGVAQQIFGGVLHLDYLERKGRDELISRILDKDPNGYVYTEWTNDGRSWHQEATLAWERGWRNHFVLLSATWQETETDNSSYDDIINIVDKNKDGVIDPVWYKGRIVDRNDLPRPDFNREWAAVFTYLVRLPYGFSFANITRYRSGYTALVNTGKDTVSMPPTDKPLDIYDEVKQPESWIFDWRIDWEKSVYQGQSLVLSLELNNVFNHKLRAGEHQDIYELGREFWLGMSYRF